MTELQTNKTRGMEVSSPTFGPIHLTWEQKHGVWFIINAHQNGLSCLHLFREVQTEPSFKAFCRRSQATYRWV